MRETALKLAPKLLGMNDEAAATAVLAAGCSYRYIVLEGERCGHNTDLDNDTVCLYSDKDARIVRVVVGSKNLFEAPAQ